MSSGVTHISPETQQLLAIIARYSSELKKYSSAKKYTLLNLDEVAGILRISRSKIEKTWVDYPFFRRLKVGIRAKDTDVYDWINNEFNKI